MLAVIGMYIKIIKMICQRDNDKINHWLRPVTTGIYMIMQMIAEYSIQRVSNEWKNAKDKKYVRRDISVRKCRNKSPGTKSQQKRSPDPSLCIIGDSVNSPQATIQRKVCFRKS